VACCACYEEGWHIEGGIGISWLKKGKETEDFDVKVVMLW
jgi:hypothetical protein